MNILHSSFRTLFARDMVIKMNYGSCLDLAKIKKATLQYTSKYVVEEPKQSFLACVAFQLITQQTPRIIHAKQSVAAFKLKEHQVVGCIVTLRRDNMYEFLQNVIYTHLPQNTYFTPIQVSKTQPNVHFGLSQVLFFSELEKHVNIFESLDGCAVQLYTTAKTPIETLLICSALKLPVESMSGIKKQDLYGTS
jgi:large subunit ribosomal protein L5